MCVSYLLHVDGTVGLCGVCGQSLVCRGCQDDYVKRRVDAVIPNEIEAI